MARGKDESKNPSRRPQRPRIGAIYSWHPTGLDAFDPKVKIPTGTLVRVAKGSHVGVGRTPRPFTYLEDPNTGEFLGLALEQSLQSRDYTRETGN
jgi:hypothetical protein